MAEILAWSTQDDAGIRFDTTITMYENGDDTINLKVREYSAVLADVELTPKHARELTRDLNAACRRAEKAKAKK
jgi:hypothetical protein